MSNNLPFAGTVVRIERDGFGIVRFDQPVGPSANTHGVFSASLSSSLPFRQLKPGVHVTGTAEADDRDLAAVKTLTVESGL